MNLRELSRHLGLSQTTVSRALGGYPEVNHRTRERVVEAARALGYSPNRSARRLASGKAGAIGMVLPLPAGHFADPFFLELMIGIGERLESEDLDLVVTAAAAGEAEIAAYRRLVGERRVDALIVARTRSADPRLTMLREAGAAFVALGRSDPPLDYAYLDVDAENAFAEACAALVGLGHRRIALINAPAELHLARLRRRGYADALAAAGIAADPALVVEADMTEADGARAAEALRRLADPPTAVLTANDPMAIGALRAFKGAGLRVPDDVSVIGYDDLPVAPLTEPPLTTLRQPVREAGSRLAEMVLARLAGEAAEALQEIWPARLVPRGSHGPAPARAAAPG
ncbi:MAG: LacI family DNA-binding transcriptional regulator [Azospirillaceae bacterium]